MPLSLAAHTRPRDRCKSGCSQTASEAAVTLAPCLFAPATPIRQHCTALMVKSVPEPPRFFLLADIRPHFVNFRRCNSANYYFHGAGIPLRQELSIDGLQLPLLFFSSLSTVSVLIPNTRAVSRMPLPLRASSIICRFTDGK